MNDPLAPTTIVIITVFVAIFLILAILVILSRSRTMEMKLILIGVFPGDRRRRDRQRLRPLGRRRPQHGLDRWRGGIAVENRYDPDSFRRGARGAVSDRPNLRKHGGMT